MASWKKLHGTTLTGLATALSARLESEGHAPGQLAGTQPRGRSGGRGLLARQPFNF